MSEEYQGARSAETARDTADPAREAAASGSPLSSSVSRGARAMRDRVRREPRLRFDQRGRDLRAVVASLPCLVSERVPVVVHHEPPRSLGGTDATVLPLAPEFHNMGPEARHVLGSVQAFEECHGIDTANCVESIHRAVDYVEAGERDRAVAELAAMYERCRAGRALARRRRAA